MTSLHERMAPEARPVRVLSDAHLRDAPPHADDPALVDLLAAIAGRDPGRLVLNGDFFDFVKVTAVPPDSDRFDPPVTAAERLYGLGTGEDRSAWKVARILDANPRVAAALRAIVGNGHEVVFLPGNHDAEIAHDAVRREVAGRIDPAGTGRVSFSEWFYYEPGRLYVEHGSQYDRENALSAVAAPAADDARGRIPMPFGIVSSRYFANTIERRCGLPPSDIGPGGYFLWVFRNHGPRALLAIARYFVFAVICLLRSGPFAGRDGVRAQAAQLGSMRTVALRCGMDLAAALRIDALRVEPILASFRKTLLRLYLPQVGVTVALWIAALAVVAAAPGRWYWAPPLIAGSLVVLAVSRGLYTGRIRDRLEQAAGSIGEILGVPCIVFGHDHNGLRSVTAPSRFVSSVWRFGGGPARIIEIPAGHQAPRIVAIATPSPEEHP